MMKQKRVIALLSAMMIFSVTFAQFEGSKQVFNSPKLETEIQKHKNVAILPFDASITYKRPPKNFDAATNKEDEQKLSISMQQGMYTYLLRKSENYSVSFQDVERTNALLRQKDIFDKDKLLILTQDSVCKILGVDAVIKCSYAYQKTSSEGGAIAKAILLGPGLSKTGSGSLTLQIYNGSDGDLLWRFYKEMNEDITGSPNQVMERMMRKVARNFPYEK